MMYKQLPKKRFLFSFHLMNNYLNFFFFIPVFTNSIIDSIVLSNPFLTLCAFESQKELCKYYNL